VGKAVKKKGENYSSYKFFIYIFAYIKTFIYLCILVEVNGGINLSPMRLKGNGSEVGLVLSHLHREEVVPNTTKIATI
jgi:hypothetical protein